jgi:hypothetical protein
VNTPDLTGTGQVPAAPSPPQKLATGEGPNWQEQDGVLREMWMRNQPPAAIAEALGRSVPAIMTRAARLGLPRRFAPGRKPGRRQFETTETANARRAESQRTKAPSVTETESNNIATQVSTRICLMCLDKFQSMGRHNRICPTCKNSAEFESGSRLPDLDFPVGDS